MARHPRQISSSGIYHVILRGINKQRIFEEDADYQRFLYSMAAVKEKSGCIFYAYCLMSNHVHILLRTNEEPLALLMKRLALKYVVWFNAKYERSGHLFQNRYKSSPVEDEAYFFTVLCYIFQNPVVAKITKTPAAYKWSSRRLLGKKGSLIDENALREIVSIDAVIEKDSELVAESCVALQSGQKPGRKPRYGDEAVLDMIATHCGTTSVSAFQALGQSEQKECLSALRRRGVSIRQIARVTGLSKGVVERWCHSRQQVE